ncbi:MAG: hypothetical protein WCC66_06385 [Rhizobiaceae bacterium]
MKLASLAAVFLLSSAWPVLADSLDGDWCNKDGAHLRIEGPQIELAPGVTVVGKYARHQFSYIAPPGDQEAGAEILFVQRSEEEMRRVRDPQAMPEHEDIWRRCQTISRVPFRHSLKFASANS